MIFNKFRLEDITDKIGDGIHGTPEYDENGDFYFVNGNNLVEGDIVFKSDTKRINEEQYLKNKRDLNKKTLLVSINGTLGNVAKYNNEKIILGKSACYINIKDEYNVDYVYFVFKSPEFKKYLQYGANGTTIKNVPLSAIRNYEISIPSKENQDKIVKILKSIEDKIKLNDKINNNLRELINQNYSNYLCELDDYTELDIKDIFDFETGVEPGSKNYLEKREENSIKFYRVGDMNSECNTFIKEDLSNAKLIDENDVVVSFDGTIGRIGYGLKGAYSTGMKKISINSKYKNIIDNSLVYAYFNSKDIQNIMMENARGTTILHASSSVDFMNFKYNENLLKKYGKLISVAFDKMKSIKNENEKLSKLKDTLLPKLMNGEIDLDNIQI